MFNFNYIELLQKTMINYNYFFNYPNSVKRTVHHSRTANIVRSKFKAHWEGNLLALNCHSSPIDCYCMYVLHVSIQLRSEN